MSKSRKMRDGKQKRKKKAKKKTGGWEVWDTPQKDERQLARERKQRDRARGRQQRASSNQTQSEIYVKKRKKSNQQKLASYIAWNRRQTSGYSARQLSTHIEIVVTNNIVLTEVDLTPDTDKLSRIKRKQLLNSLNTVSRKLP